MKTPRPSAQAALVLLAAFLGAALLVPPLAAQAAPGPAEAGPVLPYPAFLRAAMRLGRVEIDWVDHPGALGGYRVYRHRSRIDASNLAEATALGDVAQGIRSYVDLPPDESEYYYLVLALGADGSPFPAFVPASNETAAPISLKPALAAAPAPAPLTPAPAPEIPLPSRPRVEALSAQPRGDSIVLSYKGGEGERLVAYRGTSPIARASDLLDAVLVATFLDKGGSFVDFPVPGIEYWYALLVEDELKAGRIELVAGRNATAQAARLALTSRNAAIAEVSPSSRTPPLPAFLLDAATGIPVPESPVEAPQRRAVSPDTEKAVSGLLALAPQIKRPLPPLRLLAEELSPPSGGEDYALSLIVTEKLVPGDWAGAAEQLRKYLSLNRGEGAAARARFYLGEALAYAGASREAFFEFLTARDRYPTESAPWIEYVLAELRQRG